MPTCSGVSHWSCSFAYTSSPRSSITMHAVATNITCMNTPEWDTHHVRRWATALRPTIPMALLLCCDRLLLLLAAVEYRQEVWPRLAASSLNVPVCSMLSQRGQCFSDALLSNDETSKETCLLFPVECLLYHLSTPVSPALGLFAFISRMAKPEARFRTFSHCLALSLQRVHRSLLSFAACKRLKS